MISNGIEYPGVHSISTSNGVQLAPDQVLVIAWFDGDPDLYILDHPRHLADLKRFYEVDWEADRVTYVMFRQMQI